MESQPKNPEFRNNPENFHPCDYPVHLCKRTQCVKFILYLSTNNWVLS